MSTGIYEIFTLISPTMECPQGLLLPVAAAVKNAVQVPVIGVGQVVDPMVAKTAIAPGDVELIAMGRALLADRPRCRPRRPRDGP